jgi:hypothetical protein
VKDGDSAIRVTGQWSSLPGQGRGSTVTPPTGPSQIPRVRQGFRHTRLQLPREPFSWAFREQFEYAVLGLLLAIPADGAAGYGRHPDVRTG